MRFADLAGRRVVVWGHGREGRAAQHVAETAGAHVLVAVTGTNAAVSDGVLTGESGHRALRDADVVIKSPGIAATDHLYVELRGAGVPVVSLVDLWLADNRGRTIAVTGTKGKSTSAALIHHLLTTNGIAAHLVGNIGVPVTDAPPTGWVVLELSSYQAHSLTSSPAVVVLTSLSPEHLPWHGSEAAYYDDKLRCLDHDPVAVVCPGTGPLPALVRGRVGESSQLTWTGPDTLEVTGDGSLSWPDGTQIAGPDLPLPGHHNAHNIAIALLACAAVGLDLGPRQAGESLAGFRSLPHRLQVIPSTDGRTWVDDGLATTPQACIAALETFADTEPVTVLVGGADRGLDYTPLLQYLRGRTGVTAVLMGPVGERLVEQLSDARLLPGFADAVAWAGSRNNPGRVVLLSPAATSFDEFDDYLLRCSAFAAGASSAVAYGPSAVE